MGEKEVLNIDLLRFPEKTFSALLGENGGGKTTLLRILAGVLQSDSGEITGGFGEDFFYIPQKPYAFQMPVWKSLTLGMPPASRKHRRAAAKKALEAIGAGGLLDISETKLSGGEAQKTAFARMLSTPRRLLLLDEAMSAVDNEGIKLMEKALKEYVKKNECTVIFATHSLEQARRLAEHAVLLRGGRVVFEGKISEVIIKREMSYTC